MNIVCTVTNDLSHDQRMHRICTTLAEAGHQVTLVGRKLPESKELPSVPYRTYRIECRYRKGKAFYLEFNIRLWSLLRGWRYDVICSVDLDTLIAGYCLSGNGQKWVLDAHEWFSETPEVVYRPVIRKAWRQLGRRLAHRCDARYTVGEFIAQRMEEDYECQFEVVRNLPNRISISEREKTGGVILYQGMLNPGRGIDCAIRAMAKLPDQKLWIIGEGPERVELELLARRTGVEDRVRFFGFVAPAALPDYTARAWLGLNLLDERSPSYYYSLANKALDYLRVGVPSVQMRFPEYVRITDRFDCFALLSALDSEELVEIISELARDENRYAQLSANSKVAGGELCWENEAPKLLAIYEGLAGT